MLLAFNGATLHDIVSAASSRRSYRSQEEDPDVRNPNPDFSEGPDDTLERRCGNSKATVHWRLPRRCADGKVRKQGTRDLSKPKGPLYICPVTSRV
eukprot:SAG11_NODE_207_length_12378_cov_8.404105_5_plen_96_part_00